MDPASTSAILANLTQKLKNSGQYDNFISKFSACQTDTERVRCLADLPECQGLFPVRGGYKQKNERLAETLRASGNQLFKQKDYEGASAKYTASILAAPSTSKNLALAYGNRSTTSFYMKQYAQCVVDIQMAFSHNYPTATCYKLYQRLGRCMFYLKRSEEAIKAFQQTIAVLAHTEGISEKNKQEMVMEMKGAIDKCHGIVDCEPVVCDNINICHSGIPDLESNNAELPVVSNAVELKLDSFGGRGLFAQRDIEIGEVVIVEPALTSVVVKEFNLSHCHLCCNRCCLPLPCNGCAGVVFCSLNCRDEAWRKFHWAECQILDNIQDAQGDLALLACRMVVSADYKDLMKTKEPESGLSRNAGFNNLGVYDSSDYCSAHSLINHSDKRTPKDLLSRTISAYFYLQYLEFVGYFSKRLEQGDPCDYNSNEMEETCQRNIVDDQVMKNEEQNKNTFQNRLQHEKFIVGGHILRNIMMLPCNAHEVSEFRLNPTAPAMSSTVEIGAGVYPVLSLVNHSCDPNIVRHSFGSTCVARAIHFIRAGEEILDNYGALYPTHTLSERQSKLSSQYFFSCSCIPCCQNWPLYFDIPSNLPAFRCNSCSDGRIEIQSNNAMNSANCKECGACQDITLPLLCMGEMEGSYRESLSAVIEGDTSLTHVNTMLNYLRHIDRHVCRPWRDINDSQEAIKQCLNMNANCFPQPK